MAYCPKCKGEMKAQDTVCSHCGYDFPLEPEPRLKRTGFFYSAWAEIALMAGAIVAAFGCVVWAVASVAAVILGNYLQGLVFYPISFLVSLAMLVVFVRIQNA